MKSVLSVDVAKGKSMFMLMNSEGEIFNVHGAISKRGDKYARWILFNISQMVVKLGHQCHEHPVYKYYLKKKAEGKHYYESLNCLFNKNSKNVIYNV